MNQTPVHDRHNPDLLRLIPLDAHKVVEVGCSSGALAREYKKLNSICRYVGLEIDPTYVALAKLHCDEADVVDIEAVDQLFWERHADADCWVFGDTLEHLRDPWQVLRHIRSILPEHGVVVACIPNAQHWSLQVKLSIGDFRYETSGLLDRTHLRWFTRQTIVELFEGAGFAIDEGIPRVFDEPERERFLPFIRGMAQATGSNPDVAVSDALPLQHVIRAIPV